MISTVDNQTPRDEATAEDPTLGTPEPDQGTYVQFLNHELRTPLTAAGTALQTLERQLRDVPDADRVHGLVRVALRNLERLQQTVDWVGDYAAGQGGRAQEGESTALVTLLEDLDELAVPAASRWRTREGDWSGQVEVSRRDWQLLLRQTARAFHFFAPGAALDITVDVAARADGVRSLSLVFALADPEAGSRRAVNRTGRSRTDRVADELQDLVSVNVSPALWSRLDAAYTVFTEGEAPALRIRLALPVTAEFASIPAG